MRININHLLQKYPYRAADRLVHDYRIPAIFTAVLLLAGSITFSVLNASSTNGWIIAIGIVSFLGTLFGSPVIVGIAFLYNGKHNHARNRRIARNLIKILNTRGALPQNVLEQHYNAHHLFNLRKDLMETILDDPDTKQLFVRCGPRYDTFKSAENAATTLTVPPPINNDYQTGYYQLYARLDAIRQHPELATVQNSLIDDLYGIC